MKALLSIALLLLVSGHACAQEMMEGKVVKFTVDKLTMSDKDGMQEATYDLDRGVVITCDGIVCKQSDLSKGTKIKVTFRNERGVKFVTKIAAVSEGKQEIP